VCRWVSGLQGTPLCQARLRQLPPLDY
jgi:hypothetical protein